MNRCTMRFGSRRCSLSAFGDALQEVNRRASPFVSPGNVEDTSTQKERDEVGERRRRGELDNRIGEAGRVTGAEMRDGKIEGTVSMEWRGVSSARPVGAAPYPQLLCVYGCVCARSGCVVGGAEQRV